MNRPAIVTAMTIFTAFVAIAGYHTSVAIAKLPEVAALPEPESFSTVIIEKSGRFVPVGDVSAEDDEASIEWIIDCYDQFGPESASPDEVSLNSCMPT